jgi:hypothetical protein
VGDSASLASYWTKVRNDHDFLRRHFTVTAKVTSTYNLECTSPLDVNAVLSANHQRGRMSPITSREGCCRERHPRKARGKQGLGALMSKIDCRDFTSLFRTRKSSYTSRDSFKKSHGAVFRISNDWIGQARLNGTCSEPRATGQGSFPSACQ